jgi:hypothetical protein
LDEGGTGLKKAFEEESEGDRNDNKDAREAVIIEGVGTGSFEGGTEGFFTKDVDVVVDNFE